MPVTNEQPGAYTTKTAILSIIDTYRNKGMQKPIDAQVLERCGVSVGLVPRTIQALKTLDLIDDQGNPTEVLDQLRQSAEPEFKQKLQEWLKGTYSDIFLYADPSVDSESRITDAFRSFKPVGQRSRMVSLFIGLCSAAGLRPESDRDPKSKPALGQRTQSASRKPRQPKNPLPDQSAGVPIALSGLINSLPTEGAPWLQEKRDKFVTTFESVLDYCYPIQSKDESKNIDEDQVQGVA